MDEIIGYLLTGGVAAGLIKLIDGIIQWWLARRAKKEDAKEAKDETEHQTEIARIDKIEESLKAVMEGQRYILLDRIRYLGLNYIKAGEISFDDRRLLHQMHGVYHNTLNGNGDLDALMEAVNELPLKE